MTKELDTLIIGGGPAGLMAAKYLAEQDRQCEVLEFLPSPGRKLLASGAGKCNVTNRLDAAAMIGRFGDQQRFVAPAIRNFPPAKLLDFLHDRGVETKLVDDFYYFPKSEKAGDILNILLDHRYLIHCDAAVDRILSDNGQITGVIAGGKRYTAQTYLIAAGGMGYPTLGGRGTIYPLLTRIGHMVTPPVPALCGLPCAETWPKELAGMVLDYARLSLDAKTQSEGILLFTQDGVSGPAALDLSGKVNRRLLTNAPVTVTVNFSPFDAEYWRNTFINWQQTMGKKQINNLLQQHFPARLADYFANGKSAAALLGAGERDAIIRRITASPLTINHAADWSKAMATAGGADLSQITAKSLQSKLCGNLFFAGEVLDIDGPCGGYNIQWALASGLLAAQSIDKMLK